MSEAEARIRAKAEAALRAAFPDARIVHELVVKQGSCRLDLAAITPQRLILVEVKSERDVLDRLDRQVTQAKAVSDGFMVCVADKHLEKARNAVGWHLVEREDEISKHIAAHYFQRNVLMGLCNAPARLEMLWAQELRVVAGTSPKTPRQQSILLASDTMTGAEVRKRVCAALRAREFAEADPPMTSDLFPMPTRFAA